MMNKKIVHRDRRDSPARHGCLLVDADAKSAG